MEKGGNASDKFGEYKPLDHSDKTEDEVSREYFDDEDDSDSAPTMNEKSVESHSDNTPAKNAEFEDDFAPTIIERPAEIQTPSADPVKASNQSNLQESLPPLKKESSFPPGDVKKSDHNLDEDYLPTIVERPSDISSSEVDKTGVMYQGVSKPLSPVADGDDDFTPTISEKPTGQPKTNIHSSNTKVKSSSGVGAEGSGLTSFLKSSGIRGSKGSGSSSGDDSLALDKYEIGEKIAEGGMGAILSASDLNIKRKVAMKVLLKGRQKSTENIFRFIEEGQVTGQLEHPSIVPVYELGFNDSGEVYYTMKLVRGTTLKDILKKIGKNDPETLALFPLVRLLTIFQKVCDAMAFAHSKGIVHRDLKPENIMIGDYGEVLVMDWGLAKNIGTNDGMAVNSIRFQTDSPNPKSVKSKTISPDQTSSDTTVNTKLSQSQTNTTSTETKTDSFKSKSSTISATRGIDSLFTDVSSDSMNTLDGQIMGTPNFMAPEQATGQIEKIDGRTDIYALGGILYNILTLRVPIAGKSLTEMMVNIVKGNIPPPICFNLGAKKLKDKHMEDKIQRREFPHCPSGKIPTSLSAVTMKALALKQELRYQTVQELQADIEAYQGGFATSAEEASFMKLIALMIMRNKGVSVATIASLIIVVSLTIHFVYRLHLKNEALYAEKLTVIAQSKQLETQRDELLERKAILEKQKITLEEQKGTLEKQKDILEKQKSALIEEKQKTESERLAKEKEMLQKQMEMQAKNEALEAKEAERMAKEAALASELNALRAAEESRIAEERERLAKEEEAKKREEVSITSAPEFVKKAKTLATELKWDKAMEAIETAISLDKFHSEAWFVKAWLHIGNLEFSQAVKALENSGEIDNANILTLAKSYEEKLSNRGDELNIYQLRELTKIVKAKQDFVLGDRLYQLTITEENEILDRLYKIKIELRKANLEISDIHYSFTFGEDSISLDLSKNTGLRNIWPLSGLPITNLNLAATQVEDIRPLKGMPLKVLQIPAKQPADISMLIMDMPLEEIHLHGKPSIDFTQISTVSSAQIHLHLYGFDDPEDYKLEFFNKVLISQTHLHLHGPAFDNLNLFLQIPITRLSFHNTAINDITALEGKKIEYLDITGMQIRNIKTIAFMPLVHLNLADTLVTDITQLNGMSLMYLNIANTKVKNLDLLRGMPLKFLDISNSLVTDYSVLEDLKTLKDLHINGLPIVDFRFLRQLSLRSLHMANTFASDIQMLKDMDLKELDISGTRVTSLDVLYRKQLSYLSINNTPIANLNALKGMPLRYIDISNTPVNDISPLAGMNLTYVNMAKTEVADITALKGTSLKELSLHDCRKLKDIYPLNDCKNLYKLILPDHITEILFLEKFLNLDYIGTTGDLKDLQQSSTQFWAQFNHSN